MKSICIGILSAARGLSKLSPSPDTMSLPLVYSDLKSILDVLNDEKYNSIPAVQKMLDIYNEFRSNTIAQEDHKIRNALIVVEGLDASGKTTITKALAEKVGGMLYHTPPDILGNDLRNIFDDHPELRTAFYSFGNYIAAFEISKLLHDYPVILDRFWHSTVAYALASAIEKKRNITKLPAKGDDMYIWPTDLLKPSIVVLLNVSEKERLRRISGRKEVTTQEVELNNNQIFRNNIVTAYSYMQRPNVNFIDADPKINRVLADLYDRVKHLL